MADIPPDLLERLVKEVGRVADATETYQRDVAPHIKRLREIEEARDSARAKADAERLEGRSNIASLLTSKPALVVYTAVIVLLSNYLMAIAGVAPQVVKDGLSEPAPAASP